MLGLSWMIVGGFGLVILGLGSRQFQTLKGEGEEGVILCHLVSVYDTT